MINNNTPNGRASGIVRPTAAAPAGLGLGPSSAQSRLSPSVMALTIPVPPFPTGQRGDAVAHWSLQHRLMKAAEYGVRTLPGALQADLLALFTPANAAVTGGVMAAWVVSHAYGAGEVVDAALFAFAVLTAGQQAFGGGRDLGRFAAEAARARSDAELRSAGHWFAQAVLELGAATVTALVLKRGAKLASTADEATAAEAGTTGLSAAEVDALADKLIEDRFPGAQNVGTQVVENAKTIIRFLSDAGVKYEEVRSDLRGIDLHAVQPVEIVQFEPGEIVAQYAQEGRTGSWFTRAPRGATEDDLGISAGKRMRKLFRITSPVKMLKSRSASVVDTWTEGREGQVLSPNPAAERPISDRPILSEPAPKVRAGQYTRGGGEQFFLPNARRFVTELK